MVIRVILYQHKLPWISRDAFGIRAIRVIRVFRVRLIPNRDLAKFQISNFKIQI